MDKIRGYASNRWGAYSIAAIIGVVTYVVLSNFGSILSWFAEVLNLMSPIIIGVVIAYLVNLVVVFFENRVFRFIKGPTLRNVISVIVAIIVVLALIGLFLWFVLPDVLTSVSNFVSDAKNYNSTIQTNLEKLDQFAAKYGIQLGAKTWTDTMYDEVDKFITSTTHNVASAMSTLMSLGVVASNIFVGAILAVYFLGGKKRLFEGIAKFRHALLTDKQYDRHTEFWRRSSNIFSKYISYTLLEALGVGIANAIFMIIAGLPNVTLISVIVGVTNILPTFGPIVGCVVGALVLFLNEPVYAVIFVAFTLVLQTIDGYIVKPKMFGNTLGIPSFLSLVAIVIGGKLFGSIGILLSIPFAAVLAILYHESFLPWLERKKQENNNQKTKSKN
ncbi:MAG: AI-2E family transporter [Clostridiales bacterium]|nr:AI-2E family transporter [Clostridiales bacterium]